MEENFLKLLNDSGVKLGAVNPRLIQAWFDTDCSDLLQWMCSHIKKENYLSDEEEYEFNQLDTVISKEQMSQKVLLLQNETPDLLEYEKNASSVKYLSGMMEISESREEECDNLLNINQRLHKNLLNEFDETEQIDDNYQRDLRILQEKCLSLSTNLEEIYKKNILKHNSEMPILTQTGGSLEELEQRFFNITSFQDVLTPIGSYPSDSFISPISTLEILELKNRIFQSKYNLLSVEVEMKSCRAVEYFLNETYHSASLSTEEHLKLSLDTLKSQSDTLLETMEEVFLKLSQKYVNTIQLEYYQSHLNSLKQILLNATKTNQTLYKFCAYFILLLIIRSQEKENIVARRCSLQNISRYMDDCKLRKMSMSSIVDQCNKFTSKDLQQTLGIINAVGQILSAHDQSATEISKRVFYVKHIIEKLRKNHLEKINNNQCNSLGLIKNIEFIEGVLASEATSRLVTMPYFLEIAVRQVNEDIIKQNESLKDAIKETKNAEK